MNFDFAFCEILLCIKEEVGASFCSINILLLSLHSSTGKGESPLLCQSHRQQQQERLGTSAPETVVIYCASYPHCIKSSRFTLTIQLSLSCCALNCQHDTIFKFSCSDLPDSRERECRNYSMECQRSIFPHCGSYPLRSRGYPQIL